MTELQLKDDATEEAIDFLEKQGYSVIQWVEFDADDGMTCPDAKTMVLNQSYQIIWFDHYNQEWLSEQTYSIDKVTHWAYLPTPKDN